MLCILVGPFSESWGKSQTESKGEQSVNAQIFLTFENEDMAKKYNEEANKSD